MKTANDIKTACYHCGNDCPDRSITKGDKVFCCSGCHTVYEILESNELSDYYSLEKQPGAKPLTRNEDRYRFLESPEIQKELLDFKEGDVAKVVLLLPDIHCASCVWLLENLHRLNPAIGAVQVNFVKKEAAITYNPEELSLKGLALQLAQIGYPPTFDRQRKTKGSSSMSKAYFIKLGVAGFCFGNIMLLSFPEYLGAGQDFTNQFSRFFSWLILGLSLPVLIYSASDYLRSAVSAIRYRSINIDVPIAIGIAALFAQSAFSIITNTGAGYMDSFSGFVFFLLIGRWFQDRTYQSLSFERDYRSYFPMAVSVVGPGGEKIMPIEHIRANDTLRIHHEEIIPVDCTLQAESTRIDYSFVTGESVPVTKLKGDHIYAGGKQVGPAIEVNALQPVNQSYLTQLWNREDQKKVGSYSSLSDRMSRYFTWGVLAIAAITGVSWAYLDAARIPEIVTSVLIIACPCALALSVPFTFGNLTRLFGKNGFYLKNSRVVEQLANTTDLVFDKTGTLTRASAARATWNGPELTPYDEALVRSAAANSTHPLSRHIVNTIGQTENIPFDRFTEYPGKGIEAQTGTTTIRLGSQKWITPTAKQTPATTIYVELDGTVVGHYEVGSELRPEVKSMVERLSGYEKHLLSGDNDSARNTYEALLGKTANLKFDQSPTDKQQYIAELRDKHRVVTMLGDGLNDSGALLESDAGIVVAEDVFSFSPASDAIVDSKSLSMLPGFLAASKYGIKVLKICFAFSILYNTTGLYFATIGLLTPLVAAILMPLSSITIVIITTSLISLRGASILSSN